jgi:hypothetical protein
MPSDEESRIDLRRLPTWLQYVISIGVVVLVSLLAWHFGKDDPIPAWVSEQLIPVLAWVWIGLVVVALIGAWSKRKRRKQG